MNQCKDCRFYAKPENNQPVGQCRRSPPQPAALPVQGIGGAGMTVIAMWPPVQGGQWCGEFMKSPVLVS